jgi:hypothetical protein
MKTGFSIQRTAYRIPYISSSTNNVCRSKTNHCCFNTAVSTVSFPTASFPSTIVHNTNALNDIYTKIRSSYKLIYPRSSTLTYKKQCTDSNNASVVLEPIHFIKCNYLDHGNVILSILNHAIKTSTALYEYEPRTMENMKTWFDLKNTNNFPVIGVVSAIDSTFYGFVSYSSFRNFPAFKYTVEHSIYVHHEHVGKVWWPGPVYVTHNIATKLITSARL